jgi:pimeloyl-ACP methyl ester carboxylesterase
MAGISDGKDLAAGRLGQMTVVRIDACGGVPQLHGHPGRSPGPQLAAALAVLPDGAPIAVMIHGYKFSPYRPAHDPHTHILAVKPARRCWKARSWPAHLGFTADDPADGLCIAFGWDAKARVDALGLPAVYARAPQAAAALARLLTQIADLAPQRRIDLIAHSLGCQVALLAMARLRRPAIGRVVLMAAAAYRSAAATALANPALADAGFVNVTSRENDLYDFLFQAAVHPARPGDRPLGQGLPGAPDRWVDFPIDCAGTLDALARAGIAVAPRDRRACHWSFYLRPGIFDLYTALLRDRGAWPASRLHGLVAAPARYATEAEAPDLPVFVPLPAARA